MSVIRVQKLSMPGTGGEPAGSPFHFREERRCPQRIPYLPAADGEAQKLRPQNRGRRGLPEGPCGHRLFPGRERLPVVFPRPEHPGIPRNVCAHGERLFSHRCHVEIPDTALHAKLGIEKIGPDYACGKVNVFSAVITLRYLLRDDEFKTFKAKLVKCVNGYLSLDESIGEERLLEAMGFPAEWKKITRYKI